MMHFEPHKAVTKPESKPISSVSMRYDPKRTGCDHESINRDEVSVILGSVPEACAFARDFLISNVDSWMVRLTDDELQSHFIGNYNVQVKVIGQEVQVIGDQLPFPEKVKAWLTANTKLQSPLD